MPIGVPKVPFRLPGEPSAQWVDLYNRLYRERVLFLCQELDDELANQLIGIMLYLNSEDKNKGLYIAEIELNSLNQKLKLPTWIGEEVTGINKYYNLNLISRHFTKW